MMYVLAFILMRFSEACFFCREMVLWNRPSVFGGNLLRTGQCGAFGWFLGLEWHGRWKDGMMLSCSLCATSETGERNRDEDVSNG